MSEWSADAAVKTLMAEKAYDGIDLISSDQSGTNEVVKRILREAAPVAAMSLVHMAKYSANEAMRFKAATFILERNLGRMVDTPVTEEKDPFTALLEKSVRYVEESGAR